MIKITVIALGKLKEKYLREASCEYEKRLTRYCRLNIIELNPVNLPEKPSQSEIEAVKTPKYQAKFLLVEFIEKLKNSK